MDQNETLTRTKRSVSNYTRQFKTTPPGRRLSRHLQALSVPGIHESTSADRVELKSSLVCLLPTATNVLQKKTDFTAATEEHRRCTAVYLVTITSLV